MRLFKILLGIIFFANKSFSQHHYDYSDLYDYLPSDIADYPSDNLPEFLATPQSFSVQVGDAITLPCEIHTRGKSNDSYPLLFKFITLQNQDRTIYVGDLKVRKRSRIKKIGNSFTIGQVRKSDAGKYVCRFETVPTVELSHILNVQYPAKVLRVSEESQKVVQGSTVTLQCEAEGNPPPAITWSKKEGHLPSGTNSEEGFSMTFENINRHMEGTYICTASNGIGEPSSTHMSIQVDYEPEIISEQAIMNTQNGYQATLLCDVHGRPKPSVMWYRGESPVSSEKHVMTHDGAHRHTLSITDVTEEDFGEYICAAQNKYGTAHSTIYLTGLPKQPQITSSPAGAEETSYTLAWKTETFAPIIQYRLKYKKASTTSMHHGPKRWLADQLFSPLPTGPRDPRFTNRVFRMLHPLRGLEPAEDYEVIVQVENKFGWSPDSELFKFFTKKEVAVGRSTNSGNRNVAPNTNSFVFVTVLVIGIAGFRS